MQKTKGSLEKETTTFLNVDLDIYSRSNLATLVAAFGEKVFVNYVGRERSLYAAHLELSGIVKSADEGINRFAVLLHGLPPTKQRIWDAATRREFNIGIQAEAAPKAFEIALTARTIHKVSSLNARVVITVYAPEPVSDSRRHNYLGARRQDITIPSRVSARRSCPHAPIISWPRETRINAGTCRAASTC